MAKRKYRAGCTCVRGCDLCRYTEDGVIRWPAGEDPHEIYDRLKTSIAYGNMVREALAAALSSGARLVRRVDPDQFHGLTWVHATDKAVIIAAHGAPDPFVFPLEGLPPMLKFYRQLTGVHFQHLADALEDIQAATVTKEQEAEADFIQLKYEVPRIMAESMAKATL